MAYQALYRKWRPRTFDSVVGQKDITDTLKNAIKRGTISHAFLFAGPRGTGKTSCAKIFAKALNCTNLQDGEPCNKCANCRAADNGSMPDIIEIDAASNNGVDEIRDIRDKAKYAPTQGKYKVYIIDEVHMLSIGAFNALLKTLEEPPEHVVFILATTELQKVPATIISRTQRYNFKRISKADLEKRMKYILDQEKIKYDDKALAVIAQVADGGMRDALSILDQLLSYEKGSVNYNDALQITGFAAKENIEKILLALLNKDAGNALKETQKELRSGASSKNILDELIDMATNALMISKAGGSDESGFISDELVQKIKDIPSTRYFHLITLANNALNDLRYTNQQQIPLEVFLVEASSNEKPVKQETVKTTSVNSDSDLQAEIAALKKQVVDLTQQVANEPPSDSSNQVFHLDTAKSSKNKKTRAEKAENEVKPKKVVKRTKHTNEQNRKQVYHVLANATKKDLETIKNVWPDLQSGLAVSERALLDVLEPVAASHDQVVMKCKYTLWFENASSDSDLMNKLTSEIEKFAKHKYDIVLVPDDDWLAVRKEFIESHKKEFLAKKKQKVSDIVQEEPEEKKEPKDDSKVIDKAKELFGDTVNIKD
ncbi:DNA polymerase III subunit gamma/tau [Lactobacillus acetotolerans]|uniref:DNA polymerase III subunit gamma/tau n=1 Tax=Lactobacillus acetotolerans TaxID=1600 RepID=UPI00145265B8|nr:DNA polymerase III subunit gamma/tau [Lactobacillus acetotolerans]QJD72478.1 DNA polymerase III subunit gamma/tau [Lactobacillus acetotolerans]